MDGLDALPEYPRMAGLSRENQELVDGLFDEAQPRISELTFAYLWVWDPWIDCRLARRDDALIVKAHRASEGDSYLFPPVVAEAGKSASLIREMLDGEDPPVFQRVPEDVVEALTERPDLDISEQRNRADYVHSAEQLRSLPGNKFHGKRNQIRQFFAASPDARYETMSESLASRCVDFSREWLENHPKRDLEGLQREVESSIRILENLDWLGFVGGALVEGQEVLAYALGEGLNRDTLTVRIEKADTSLPGSYQAINREFARHSADGYRWINREQDLGIPGLRKAKKSYYPDHLVRKFRIGRARD